MIKKIEMAKMDRVENPMARSGQKTRKARKVLMVMLAILLTMAGLLEAMSVGPVYAAFDTGWKDPSANAADTGGDGDGFEISPTNAYSDDVAVASNVDGVGDSHRYYGYDFGLPGGATIEGIEVRLDWYLDSKQGNSSIQVQLSWDGGTNWTGAKTTGKGSTSETTHVRGDPSDTWGHDWALGELSSDNFRLRITCNSNKSERDFYLDWVAVNVYYTVETGWTDPSANVADAGGDGDGFEGSPENAYSDDAAVASNMDGAGDSHLYYDYDFGLPGGATIEGIEVRLDWYLDSNQGNSIIQVQLSWNGGINWTNAKTTGKGSTSETTDILGGPTDNWGYSWTVGELSSDNFRVRITCNSNKSERDFYLDWVAVNVYDDPPTAVHLSSFTACSGRSVAASRGTLHFWLWVLLAGLTVLAKGHIRRAARKITY